jgi:hypothetical protein
MVRRIERLMGDEAMLKRHMIAGDHFLYCLCICKVCLNGSFSITSIASLNPLLYFGSRGCATNSGGADPNRRNRNQTFLFYHNLPKLVFPREGASANCEGPWHSRLKIAVIADVPFAAAGGAAAAHRK